LKDGGLVFQGGQSAPFRLSFPPSVLRPRDTINRKLLGEKQLLWFSLEISPQEAERKETATRAVMTLAYRVDSHSPIA